jgi:hypothetical protein
MDLKYTITFKSTGKSALIGADAKLIYLKNGNPTEATVEELYSTNKYDFIVASEFDKSTFLLPYKALNFVWGYMKRQKANQVRPRKHSKPRFKYKKTRFSRIYSDITYDKVQELITWFQENIDRKLYKVPASHHIVHRVKDICKYNWNRVTIRKSLKYKKTMGQK